ncbi:MAG: PEP-CTERM sorting domain-containing protein [Planctomycetota bacterium]
MVFRVAVVVFSLLAGAVSSVSGQLSITMDYTGFLNSSPGDVSSILNNDAWSGGTSNSDRLNAAIGVMDQAVADLEAIFANCTDVQLNQTISVGWQSHGGSTLATGGSSWNGSNQLFNGTLNWDSDGSSTFFTDLTPNDDIEYSASGNDTRSINFGGMDINVEDRHYANFTGTAAGLHSDLYSVVLHEIMHAIGILSSYPLYATLDDGADGDLDLAASGNVFEVLYSGSHTVETLAWGGPGTLGGAYYPNIIGPSTVNGTRGRLTDLDALIIANVHGFGASDFSKINQPFGTIPVGIPEPSIAILLVIASVGAANRRRR